MVGVIVNVIHSIVFGMLNKSFYYFLYKRNGT
jgi:hypothetical protein